MDEQSGLEGALARTEGDVASVSRTLGSVNRELRKAKGAAATGQLRELRRALGAVAASAQTLAEQAVTAREGYDVDEVELLSSGDYRKELLAAAREAGVAMFEDDDQLLCYPSLVRVLPSELAITVDRRRERRLRPSVVVEALARAQQAGPRFRAEPFHASLLAAYDLVVAAQGLAARGAPGGPVVRLLEVYGVLTLLPGQAKDYSRQEFARDLYLLDSSGVTTTGARQRELRWAASTGTRQAGVLSTVARSGQQQRYWGVSFTEGRHD